MGINVKPVDFLTVGICIIILHVNSITTERIDGDTGIDDQ
jgi:hypothetical protein